MTGLIALCKYDSTNALVGSNKPEVQCATASAVILRAVPEGPDEPVFALETPLSLYRKKSSTTLSVGDFFFVSAFSILRIRLIFKASIYLNSCIPFCGSSSSIIL